MIPLMPSPGRPNTVSTPQSMSRSTSDSEAILPMVAPRQDSEGASPGSFPRGDRTNEGDDAGRVGYRGACAEPSLIQLSSGANEAVLVMSNRGPGSPRNQPWPQGTP